MNPDSAFLFWYYFSPLAWVTAAFWVVAYYQDKDLTDEDFLLSVPLFLQVSLKNVVSEV